MNDTLITFEVDFEAHGKQRAYLRMLYSVHRSAYGWIPVPITIIRNGDGPTLVISASVQDDEHKGQIAVANLACNVKTPDIRGRLIPLPIVSLSAAEAGRGVTLSMMEV